MSEEREIDFSEIAEFLNGLKFRRKLFGANQEDVFACMKDLDGMYREKVEEMRNVYKGALEAVEGQLGQAQQEREDTEKDKEINRLHEKSDKQEKQIARQSQAINELTGEMKEQTNQLVQQKNLISELERMQSETEDGQELRENNSKLLNTLEQAKDELASANHLVSELSYKLQEKSGEAEKTEQRMEELEALLEKRNERIEDLTLELWEFRKRKNLERAEPDTHYNNADDYIEPEEPDDIAPAFEIKQDGHQPAISQPYQTRHQPVMQPVSSDWESVQQPVVPQPMQAASPQYATQPAQYAPRPVQQQPSAQSQTASSVDEQQMRAKRMEEIRARRTNAQTSAAAKRQKSPLLRALYNLENGVDGLQKRLFE